MRFILILSFLLSLSFVRASESKKDSQFENIRQLVTSNRFRAEADRAFPSRGKTIDLFSNRGFITLSDSLARGFLPFFGRAYSLPYGDGGGIEFDSTVQNRQILIKDKKKNKTITYRFSVRGKNDLFNITLLITSSGNCTITVQSNQRSSISYSGKIYPLQEEEPQP